jgi:signal peptidase I
MIIRNYTFQNFKIPSSSMEQTLLIGDYLVANKLKYYFVDPQRGDIVTFRNPDPNDESMIPRERLLRIVSPIYFSKDRNTLIWQERKNVVKRVIGMPGDKVEIRNKVVFINDIPYLHGMDLTSNDNVIVYQSFVFLNGRPIESTTEQFTDSYPAWPNELNSSTWSDGTRGSRDNMGPVTVPENHYFVLGDNRDLSLDSRFWGFLSRADITGTPAMIFFSRRDGITRWDRSFSFIK